jgi:hypothetical protein
MYIFCFFQWPQFEHWDPFKDCLKHRSTFQVFSFQHSPLFMLNLKSHEDISEASSAENIIEKTHI